MRTLVLVPSPLEFGFLAPSLEERLAGPFVGGQDGDWTWAVSGIGPAAAACSASMLCEMVRPERVLMLGIAGAYPGSGLQIGELVQAESECLADLGALEKDQFLSLEALGLPHLPLTTRTIPSRFPVTPLSHELQRRHFATVSTITSSHERAKWLAEQFQFGVENMEGAGAALACVIRGLPFHELRVVSNLVGPREPKSWPIKTCLANLRAALTQIKARGCA